jgi:hypothetical protein
MVFRLLSLRKSNQTYQVRTSLLNLKYLSLNALYHIQKNKQWLHLLQIAQSIIDYLKDQMTGCIIRRYMKEVFDKDKLYTYYPLM